MKSIPRQLLSNLGAVVLALLLAIVIWIMATLDLDPLEDRIFPNVSLHLIHQPENTVLLSAVPRQITVTARAQRSELEELDQTDFRATLDLTGVPTGTSVTVPISATCRLYGARVRSIVPEEQSVLLEELKSDVWPVEIRLTGQVAQGYEYVRSIVSPSQVEIRGPRSYLEQVASVVAPVELEGLDRNFTTTVSVMLLGADGDPAPGLEQEVLDASGQRVPGLQVTQGTVSIRVDVRSYADFRHDIRVVPVIAGQPAPGYRQGTVSVQPAFVKFKGTAEVLETLPDFVETEPVPISGTMQTQLWPALLVVPDGVDVVDDDYETLSLVNVTVRIEPILATRALTGTIEIIRVPPEWRAVAIPPVVDVTVEGPQVIVSNLRPEDLRVFVNVSGSGLGVYAFEPQVTVKVSPETVRLVSVVPETVLVRLEAIPTPTPTPTLTITPTSTITP